MINFSVLVIMAIGIGACACQTTARCFSFTWLGPSFHNGSEFMNATCSEATRLAAGVPCFQPLVVSYDGTRPDVNYIWENHGAEASCVLGDADVCATYSYFFNGMVENVTHMCTRVEESAGRVVNSGCYDYVNGNYRTRACLCRSSPGAMPCNRSGRYSAHLVYILPITVLAFWIS